MARRGGLTMSRVNQSADGNQRWWTWRDLFLVRTAGAPTLSAVKQLSRAMLDHRNTLPHGTGLVFVIESVTGPPPEEVRKELAAQFDRFGPKIRAMAYVVEARGFAAAAVRAVITATHVLQRRPYAQHTADNVSDALRWILPKLEGGAARANDLRDALAGLEQDGRE
jgi:hypothetical protein